MSLLTLRCVPVAALLLVLAGALPADDVLTWQDCFSAAVSNNLDLSIARLKLKEAEATLKSQQSVYYPDVTAKASKGLSGSKSDGDANWENGESLSASLNASYTLFDGFGNRARVTQTEAELYAEKANFDQTCSNVQYDLRKAFTDQLYAQELVNLMENIAARRADNTRLVELRYEGGREHKDSLLLKQAQLTEARYNVEEARRSLELARRKLASLMNLRTFEPFTLEGVLRAEEPPAGVSLDELACQTPTYRSAEADVKAAEQGFIITRSTRFPQITASASLSASGEHTITAEGWNTGIALSLPLFTGGQLSQDIIVAGLKKEQSRLTAENTMLDLMDNLQSALNTYRSGYDAMSVQKELLQAAEARATVSRARYEQGLSTFQDWDTIETALISAQRSWLSSRRTADQAEAAWQNTMGLSEIR
jgi:outer membrane protein TolC